MRKRIFSGIKPTGDLHIGNYLGAIKNWIALQDEIDTNVDGDISYKYDCIYSIVDLHAMTTEYTPETLKENVFKIACNYLACGLDPKKSILMVQSSVKYHAELCWILNCLTPVSWLERVPTFKEKILTQEENINMGLLDYAVLMTADVILYNAVAVPVGEDQLPHLELAREILRRFNSRFGETFPELKGILSKGARVKGLDGAEKMGKSLDNCIYLYEDYDMMWHKISKAVTDTARIKKTDAGNPEVCNIYSLQKLFSDPKDLDFVVNGCKNAEIGCIQCKKLLTQNMCEELEPIRSKYLDFMKKPDFVFDILHEGSIKANRIAQGVMDEVYQKIGINYTFLKK